MDEVYKFYVSHVSIAGYAISLEASKAILDLMVKYKPETILDLGSGWSSYLLRLKGAEVWSVDTDKQWLEKTKVFLKQFDMFNGHFNLLKDFNFWEHNYDLVLVDHKPGRERYKLFELIKYCCNDIVVFDDCQNDGIRSHAKRVFSDWQFTSLAESTMDGWKRYICYAQKPQS